MKEFPDLAQIFGADDTEEILIHFASSAVKSIPKPGELNRGLRQGANVAGHIAC
jgi:hypothetical protein